MIVLESTHNKLLEQVNVLSNERDELLIALIELMAQQGQDKYEPLVKAQIRAKSTLDKILNNNLK